MNSPINTDDTLSGPAQPALKQLLPILPALRWQQLESWRNQDQLEQQFAQRLHDAVQHAINVLHDEFQPEVMDAAGKIPPSTSTLSLKQEQILRNASHVLATLIPMLTRKQLPAQERFGLRYFPGPTTENDFSQQMQHGQEGRRHPLLGASRKRLLLLIVLIFVADRVLRVLAPSRNNSQNQNFRRKSSSPALTALTWFRYVHVLYLAGDFAHFVRYLHEGGAENYHVSMRMEENCVGTIAACYQYNNDAAAISANLSRKSRVTHAAFNEFQTLLVNISTSTLSMAIDLIMPYYNVVLMVQNAKKSFLNALQWRSSYMISGLKAARKQQAALMAMLGSRGWLPNSVFFDNFNIIKPSTSGGSPAAADSNQQQVENKRAKPPAVVAGVVIGAEDDDCAECGLSPPNNAQPLRCGHVMCHLCLQLILITSSSSSPITSSAAFSGRQQRFAGRRRNDNNSNSERAAFQVMDNDGMQVATVYCAKCNDNILVRVL